MWRSSKVLNWTWRVGVDYKEIIKNRNHRKKYLSIKNVPENIIILKELAFILCNFFLTVFDQVFIQILMQFLIIFFSWIILKIGISLLKIFFFDS